MGALVYAREGNGIWVSERTVVLQDTQLQIELPFLLAVMAPHPELLLPRQLRRLARVTAGIACTIQVPRGPGGQVQHVWPLLLSKVLLVLPSRECARAHDGGRLCLRAWGHDAQRALLVMQAQPVHGRQLAFAAKAWPMLAAQAPRGHCVLSMEAMLLGAGGSAWGLHIMPMRGLWEGVVGCTGHMLRGRMLSSMKLWMAPAHLVAHVRVSIALVWFPEGGSSMVVGVVTIGPLVMPQALVVLQAVQLSCFRSR